MQVLEGFRLDEEHVSFLESCSYEDAINTLVQSMENVLEGKSQEVVKKVLERERVVSTAIGKAIAIPHGRCSFLKEFSVAVGICKAKGILWNAIDGQDVQIICLIAGPEDNPRGYLSFLSHITSILNEEKMRLQILNATDKKNIVNIFNSC